MAERLSQKMVADEFYEWCINEDVPCLNKHDGKRGFFLLQYSYGGMQLQYKSVCGGATGISSGFVGAREMDTWLKNFDPKSQYAYYRKIEIQRCNDMKKRGQKK